MVFMIMNWLRESKYAAGFLTIVRLYLGWAWITGGWGKLTGEKAFDATGFLTKAVEKPVMKGEALIYPTYTGFIENFALPNIKLFNFLVPWGEFLIGLGLLLGALTTAAVFFGMLMNFMFMFAGTISTNPWMVMLSIFILAAGANAGKFGADYYLLPYLKKMVGLKEIMPHRPDTPNTPPTRNIA